MNTIINVLAIVLSWTMFLPVRVMYIIADAIDRALDMVDEDLP